MELEKLELLAQKIKFGFSSNKPTNPQMEINHAENQSIRRAMKKDNFSGTIPFYLAQLCLNLIESIEYECKQSVILEKLRRLQSESPEKSKQVSELLNLDIGKLLSLSGCGGDDKLGYIDEDIYFCASIAILSKLAAKKTDGKRIFQALKEIFDDEQ